MEEEELVPRKRAKGKSSKITGKQANRSYREIMARIRSSEITRWCVDLRDGFEILAHRILNF